MLNVTASNINDRLSVIVARLAAQHGVHHDFVSTDHLVDGGFSSMAMVDLMLAVEAEFDVTIPQREMKPANFQSIASLSQMLEHMRAAAA